MSHLTLLKAAPWALAGVAALVAALMFGLWKNEKAAFAGFKVAQAKAVIAAQERADSLANELVIEQAKNMAGTEKVVIEYRTQIRNAPDDAARLGAIARGMRDITRGRGSPSAGSPPDAVPASRADRKP